MSQSTYEPPRTPQATVAHLMLDITRLKNRAKLLHEQLIPIDEYWKDLAEFEEYYSKILYGSVVEQLDERATHERSLTRLNAALAAQTGGTI